MEKEQEVKHFVYGIILSDDHKKILGIQPTDSKPPKLPGGLGIGTKDFERFINESFTRQTGYHNVRLLDDSDPNFTFDDIVEGNHLITTHLCEFINTDRRYVNNDACWIEVEEFLKGEHGKYFLACFKDLFNYKGLSD